MLVKHLFDGHNVLLTLVAEDLILTDQEFDELIERVDLLELNEGKILDKGGEFLLLSQEGAILKVAD
jgi:hypothetical protein